MRGFTMLLVVCTHVEVFMVGSAGFSINGLLGLFRMPLFFFVSGFVFYKAGRGYGISGLAEIVRKKIFVQVLSPLLLLLLFCEVRGIDITVSLFTAAKSGYWFTFVLMEFFLTYWLIGGVIGRLGLGSGARDVLWAVTGLAIYAVAALWHGRIDAGVSGLLAVEKMPYFLYFVLGTRVRKNWAVVERLLGSKYVMAVAIVLFVWLNVAGDWLRCLPLGGVVWLILMALAGVTVTLGTFRHYAVTFSSATWAGRLMQFVGRRTLDIYLLHYFFMEPLYSYGVVDFTGTNLCFVQFVTCVVISGVVIAACMALSGVLRSSGLLGHYLFGAKIR